MTGLVGGALCLIGHLPCRVRQWAPHAVALAAMLPMAPGSGGRVPLVAGTVALVVAFLWQLRAGCPSRGSAESVDTAAMALLAAAMVVVEGSHHAGGVTGDATAGLADGVAPAGFATWPVLFAVACWGVARAAAVLVRQAWPPRLVARPPARRALLLGEAGGALMVTAMAVMLGLP
ncbi:hypothetical protein [Streptomyces sp. NPDC059786]|uniref:hypothetical protein n=1 Tax=Streptomyces sp. NPDC059786 TaxID=3346946 RepID=UPI0036625396